LSSGFCHDQASILCHEFLIPPTGHSLKLPPNRCQKTVYINQILVVLQLIENIFYFLLCFLGRVADDDDKRLITVDNRMNNLEQNLERGLGVTSWSCNDFFSPSSGRITLG